MSVSWLFLFWGFRVYNDIGAVALGLVGFYLYLRDRSFFSGLFFGLSFLMRFPSALLFFSIILVLIFGKSFKKFFFSCFGFVIALIPFLIFDDLINVFISQYSIVATYTVYQSSLLHLVNLLFVSILIMSFLV